MSLAAIMQPTFFSWIGYYDIIDQVDYFVFYDDVQLARRSWQVRNRVKTANGEHYLVVPIKKTKNRDDLMICEAEICYNENWQSKHLKTLYANYKKAKHFDSVYAFVSDIYNKKQLFLCDLSEDFIKGVLDRIGIPTVLVRSSELKDINGGKDVRLASICTSLSCNEYLSPQGSSIYIESFSPGGELTKQGIGLYYQFYKHPVYHQLYGPFVPNLSIVDLLFNEGFENTLSIIRDGRQQKMFYKEFRTKYLNLD